jgi:hypothetical protein
MKKVILGVFAIGLLASCGGGNTPESVATAYLTALKDKNWAKAKELGTEKTQNYIATFEAPEMESMQPGITEVKDVKCEVTDTSAVCSFCCSSDGKSKINLVKAEDGSWKVDDGKEMPNFDDLDMEGVEDSLNELGEELEGVEEEATETEVSAE